MIMTQVRDQSNFMHDKMSWFTVMTICCILGMSDCTPPPPPPPSTHTHPHACIRTHWIENYNFAYTCTFACCRLVKDTTTGLVERLAIRCVDVAARGQSHSRHHQEIWQPNSYRRTNGQWTNCAEFGVMWFPAAQRSRCAPNGPTNFSGLTSGCYSMDD